MNTSGVGNICEQVQFLPSSFETCSVKSSLTPGARTFRAPANKHQKGSVMSITSEAPKPVVTKANSVYRSDGAYNWLKPGEKQAQFCFTLAEDSPFERGGIGIVVSLEVANEIGDDTPLGTALALLAYAKRCIFHSDKENLGMLVAYLQTDGVAERDDYFEAKADVPKIEKQISDLSRRLGRHYETIASYEKAVQS